MTQAQTSRRQGDDRSWPLVRVGQAAHDVSRWVLHGKGLVLDDLFKELIMQLRDNGLRFSPITIVLHWLVAVLLLSMLGLGVAIAHSPGEARLVPLQNLLGTLLFLISVYRFWARVSSFHPLPVGSPNPVEVIVARSVATALALAMVLLPLS